MKHMVKLGVASSLALASVGAHAAITVGTIASSSTAASLGDVVLFADIYNGSTLVSAYVGDTGSTVASVGAGNAPTTFDDANLATFLGKYQTGYTVLWAVEGAGTTGYSSKTGVAPYVLTSAPNTGVLGGQNGQLLKYFDTGLIDGVNNFINGTVASATSWVGADTSSLTGNYFDPTKAAVSAANFFGASASDVNSVGLGTVANLYTMAATGTGITTATTITAVLGVSLTANGLVYSALGNNNPPPVPLPAAVWLLGSGLLGLAGVGRRKNKAA